ncbi:MAG: hypothetical protein ABI893_00970 [Polaromonas sp.]|uniref:hypothetical protein n=1 Tax=Polaromonas sp. TaxID=1869339 RepID=UPI0032674F04
MKIVHICVALLVCLAVVLAFTDQSKAAVGLCLLSTLIEVIGAAFFGKKQNT